MKASASNADPAPERSGFPTTHWSIVADAGAGSESEARVALETLCRRYWYPLYSFIRRQGRSHHEAEDVTQEFLARLLANEGIATARPDRGRFRTFLLTALRNFLTSKWRRAHAIKRGGGIAPVSLDLRLARDRFVHEPVDPAITPEQAFDRVWALDMLDRAVGQLRKEYEKSGRGELFEALAPLAWGGGSAETFAAPAARLGMTTSAFIVALHRLRQRISFRLRAEVAHTVARESEIDAELRYLIAAVQSHPTAR